MSAAAVEEQPFTAYVAHELRTPLATQRVLLELALADAGTDLAAWRETAEGALRACLQQERLIEACLTLARSQSGARRCEPVDLAAVAADALDLQDGSGLDRIAALEPAWTAGDPDLLERLVVNLVSNAVRHNVDGGRIDVATREHAGRAHVTVVNTGPVVPADELRRLFRPFQRLGESRGDGVGLGLAIVRAIADAHAAVVRARARTGGGLRIDVAFPALD